ncbi:MAG TPA: lysophospholipid acyltransferase family protein [Micromonosporaceae bacterium]
MLEPLVPARPNPAAANVIYHGLVRPALRRQFHRVWVRVDGPLPRPVDGPLLAYANHPSWWDGFAAMLIDRELLRRRYRGYVMVDQEQLRRYRFFRWCGAFSVDRQRPRSALASVRYASDLLAGATDRALWIFPQGELRPNDLRPITVQSGLARIALATPGVQLWPVAMRYEFGHEQRPELFLRVGPAHRAGGGPVSQLVADLAARLTRAVDGLRDQVVTGDRTGFEPLLAGRPGINQRWDRIRGLSPSRPERRSG